MKDGFWSSNNAQPGGVISPAVPEGHIKTIERPTWFFFINDELLAKYSHKTRYVYIDASHPNPSEGDGIIVHIQGWWPKINGEDYYKSSNSTKDPDWVYGNDPEFPELEKWKEEILREKGLLDESLLMDSTPAQ